MELHPASSFCKTHWSQSLTARRRPPTRIFSAQNENRSKTSISDPTTAEVKTKIAVAAKIRAARTLARKLAEEKEAAAAAAQLASQSKVDPETAAELIRSAKAEVAELAKEAAHADAQARSATKSSAIVEELQRLKAENAALTEMVMQVASDRAEAERKLEALRKGEGKQSMVSGVTKSKTQTPSLKPSVAKQKSSKAPASSNQENWAEAMIQAAEKCVASHVRVTTIPEAPEVGSSVRILYNLAAGPLPKDPSTAPALKMGLNRWETQFKAPMQQAFSKSTESVGGSDGWWYYVDVPLPKLLFRVDFVVEDTTSGVVDNNGGKDFTFDLQGAPTAEEVTAARLELLEAHEAAVRATFEKEEQRMKRIAMSAAEGAAREAALAYLATRKESMLAEARAVVSERRGPTAQANPNYKEATEAIQLVMEWEDTPVAGQTAVLLYRPSGPLAQVDFGDEEDDSVLLHLGYDNWWMKDTRILPMKRHKKRNGWWSVEVPVWKTAGIVDFVFSNSACSVWDNNGGKDYHTIVQNAVSGEALVASVLAALEAAGAEESAQGEALASRRVLQRAATKCEAGRRRREMQRRFLYTDPVVPVAGQRVDVYYNPDKTVLRGRPDIYVYGSFNRWTHPPFGPVRMEPAVPDAGGIGFQVASVVLPADAHTIDLVFSDSPTADQNSGGQSGFCDDNKGLGYHISSISSNRMGEDGSGQSQRSDVLRISHVAAEMAPIAKAGGLGDVVTALGRAVQEEGHHVDVVLPKYDCIDYSAVKDLVFEKEFGWDNTSVKVWRGTVEGLETVFLEPCNGLFWVGRIYTDMGSDRHRFGVFCACAIKYLLYERGGERPNIIHAHDWQSAPVTFLPKDGVPVSCVFTIHNLNYGADLIGKAMAESHVATTVSPTYAEEVAGHPAIAPHQPKFYGVRNGIDTDVWDPAADPFVPEPFYITSEDESDVQGDFEVVRRGKAAAKALLRKRMGLGEGDVPLVGCVTRLTPQKGIHLIKHAAWRAMERGAQFILLGSAPDPAVQADFDALAADLAARYPDRARLWFAYDEGLAHLIYAAADIFLVPSMFEPCGLTQMIAMRYGAVPVVRRTGGLADTVFDVDDDVERAAQRGMTVNGYSFDGADAAGMDYALNRALTSWYEGDGWDELVASVMRIDWSWAGPAQDYIEIYYKAMRSQLNV